MTNGTLEGTPDFKNIRGTDLMIRTMILVIKASLHGIVERIDRRNPRDTVDILFTRTWYNVTNHRIDTKRYHVRPDEERERTGSLMALSPAIRTPTVAFNLLEHA